MVFLLVIGTVGLHEWMLDEVILIKCTDASVFMRSSVMYGTKPLLVGERNQSCLSDHHYSALKFNRQKTLKKATVKMSGFVEPFCFQPSLLHVYGWIACIGRHLGDIKVLVNRQHRVTTRCWNTMIKLLRTICMIVERK